MNTTGIFTTDSSEMLSSIKRKSVLGHIALFIVVEIVFVLIVFREFPETSLYTTIGVAHIVYWIVVLLCSVWREKAHRVTTKFLALWTPMVFHLLLHIFIGLETFEAHGHDHGHAHGHHHGSEETLWLIIGTLAAGVIIYIGEKLLHKRQHCITHHAHTHKNCVENNHGECEGSCQ